MHPLLSRPSRLLLYMLAWATLGVGLAAALTQLHPRPWSEALLFAVPLAVIYGFVCLSAWWVCRMAPLVAGKAMRAVTAQLVGALQACGIWASVASGWAVFLAARLHTGFLQPDIVRDVLALMAFAFPAYLMSAVLHYLFFVVQASHAAERLALEAQVSAREAELRALRAQLNPHFLFNSLNSINSLIGGDPEGARRMCEGLGEFLRRTLNLGARDAVPLSEELALVDRYLAIEQVRFGARLAVERAIEPGAEACRVPPLLLQPLVENAVKHGVSGRVEGGTVRIEAKRDGGRLLIAIENPVDEDAPKRKGEGLGLENVRRRLSVLGGRDANLDARRNGTQYRVQLSLTAHEEAAR